jgi:uncharacterized repeat protein (TIGR03803 family)
VETCIKKSFALPMLVAGLSSVLVGQVAAQTFTTLYNFTGWPDGGIPECTLVLSGNSLYGTTAGGGSGGSGTVFKVNTDGTGFTTLYSFGPTDIRDANSDGAFPAGDLVLASNTLYGTTSSGGLCTACGAGGGTVFKVNTDGTSFTVLHIFAGGNSDGAAPSGGLRLSGNTLFGTTGGGGNSNNGTVFALNTDGTGFAILYSFGPSGTNAYGWFTNSYQWFTNGGGALLYTGLILSDNKFYGTTANGGSFGNGTVFTMNMDGTGLTILHEFTGPAQTNASPVTPVTNSDGAFPSSSLILVANTLYGTASEGGIEGQGTVFKVNTDGTGFMTLHNFTDTIPYDAFGNVFITNSDGANPVAGLTLSGNIVYGTASRGGSTGNGTIFSISLAPQLRIVPSGSSVVLAWPTNFTGFTLQTTTSLDASAIWTTNLPAPVVVNGQNTVIKPIAASQEYFRLSQ